MALKFVALVLGLANVVYCLPATTLEDLTEGDMYSVGSYIREVRAAAPEDYHKSYENEGEGEIGYSRKKAGGGKKGYQHFDSYHKKAGDNYAFEKQDSFGLDDEGDSGSDGHSHEGKAENYSEPAHEEYEEEEEEAEEGEESKKQEKKSKPAEADTHEELRETSSDGNGGSEAIGHDTRDYVLPEKYIYGKGDEYNF